MAEGWSGSWKISWSAGSIGARPAGSPVPELRSTRGYAPPVTRQEPVPGWPHLDVDPPHAVGPGRRARRQHAAHTLADADRRAGRRDITQPDHEVGVRAAGPDIQFGGHRSDDAQPGRERPACEGEHILARLKAAVVLRPGVADEGWPVHRGRGVLRIVTVGIGR